MTTRQTTTPITHTTLQARNRRASELVRDIVERRIDVTPPYQRGDVWDLDQRIALILSWLTGIPSGVVVLSDRGQEAWRRGSREDVYRTGAAMWACVDGKQRLTTAQLWFSDELAVPASWFAPEYVAAAEPTEDGPYVRHTGLTLPGQRLMDSRAQFLVAEFSTAATVEDEAAVYLLVNNGGTPHSGADLERARQFPNVD